MRIGIDMVEYNEKVNGQAAYRQNGAVLVAPANKHQLLFIQFIDFNIFPSTYPTYRLAEQTLYLSFF